MRKLFLSILCTCGLLIAIHAQDSTTARDHIKYLSSEELHGRGVAYNGEHKAADYIINNLKSFGVEPLSEEYIQKYKCPAFAMEGDVKCCIGNEIFTA